VAQKSLKIISLHHPHEYQQEIREARERFKVLVCHRRFGKTVEAINQLIEGCVEAKAVGKERPRFFYIAPLFRQAKQVAWDYLLHYASVFPDVVPNQSELRVDLLGDCRIQLLGADNPDSLRGVYADGVVLDEYAQMAPTLWTQVIRPALSDRKGWAIFIGTPAGKNQFWELYQAAATLKDWYRVTYRASDTGLIDEDELAAAQREMTQEEYDQEYECSFHAAIRGAYYVREMTAIDKDNRICSVPVDITMPVHTAWDLGVSDSTVIWFFQLSPGGEIRVVDYLEGSGVGLDHYARLLKEKDYYYGSHIAPHDIKVRELGTGKSRLEIAANLGIRFIVAKNLPIMDGIQSVRSILPRCYFDSKRCAIGIEALRQYRTDYDDRKRVFSLRPRHDWTSHAADSFRYLAVGHGAVSFGSAMSADTAKQMYEQYARPIC